MIVSPLPVSPSGRRVEWSLWWPRLRWVGGVVVLGLLLWRLGAGPFLAGVAALNLPAILAAAGIGAITTVCSAWRWRVVAGRLGVGLSMRAAVAAYYGSQFLNSTLPGGLLGDVHRAVRHGRATGAAGRGARSVAWERVSGPVVHLALTAVVLLAVPVPWPGWVGGPLAGPLLLAVVAGGLVGFIGLVGLVGLALARRSAGRAGRWVSAAAADLRTALLARSAWPQVLLASVVVVVGHAVTFVLAARLAGVDASPVQLFAAAMLVLAAMLVPFNVGGWGPREGAAAGLFAAAGWGAAQGVAAATAFGVLTLIATLPGLVVLVGRSSATRMGRRPVGGRPVGGRPVGGRPTGEVVPGG